MERPSIQPDLQKKPNYNNMFNPFNMVEEHKVILGNEAMANILFVDDRVRPLLPRLIMNGEMHPRFIAKLAYARYLYESSDVSNYEDVLLAAENVAGAVPAEVPARSESLEKRLAWTLRNRPEKEALAKDKRQETTDKVRETLIPRYNKKGLNFVTQTRLIHRAHMRNNEHIILNKSQAHRMLVHFIEDIDRLGGKVRDQESFPAQIGLANGTMRCPAYQDTPDLLNYLGEFADELFPIGSINPEVTEDNIHHYLSFIQLEFALIHPFYEANGRTSEDILYTLWGRRPDLDHTIRYLSPSGDRTDEKVEQRMSIINNLARGLAHQVGQMIGATEEELDRCSDHSDLFPVMKERIRELLAKDPEEMFTRTDQEEVLSQYIDGRRNYMIELYALNESERGKVNDEYIQDVTAGVYYSLLSTLIKRHIDLIKENKLKEGDHSAIDHLANDLKSASNTYTFADGRSVSH